MQTTINIISLVILLLIAGKLFINKTPGVGKKRAVILDSCALIDGRIVDLAQAGFVPERIIIPAFILRELQFLADGNDSQKRERARFGLDVAKELTGLGRVSVEIDRTHPGYKETDDNLVALAQTTGAQLYTTDFNLLKVAEVEGVSTLNVNELAQKLRPNVLPGETMKIKIIQKGSGAGQGVGYSDDGTMVVVEKADKQIGKVLDVTVDRMFNTMAGKMIFAKSKQAVVPNPQPTKTTKGYRTAQPKPRTPAQKPAHDGFVTDLRRELQG